VFIIRVQGTLKRLYKYLISVPYPLYCRVHTDRPFVSDLSQMTPVHCLPSSVLMIYLNLIFRLPSGPFYYQNHGSISLLLPLLQYVQNHSSSSLIIFGKGYEEGLQTKTGKKNLIYKLIFVYVYNSLRNNK